jgi:glycerol-3-phosphate dehydrogenase
VAAAAISADGHGLAPVVIGHLAARYGSRLAEVLAVLGRDARLGEPIVPALPDRRVEVVAAVEQEWALTLEDVLRRRTRVALEDAAAGTGVVDDVAALMAERLGWTGDETRAAAARYVEATASARRWR